MLAFVSGCGVTHDRPIVTLRWTDRDTSARGVTGASGCLTGSVPRITRIQLSVTRRIMRFTQGARRDGTTRARSASGPTRGAPVAGGYRARTGGLRRWRGWRRQDIAGRRVLPAYPRDGSAAGVMRRPLDAGSARTRP